MEWWNDGKGKGLKIFFVNPAFQYSNIPSFLNVQHYLKKLIEFSQENKEPSRINRRGFFG